MSAGALVVFPPRQEAGASSADEISIAEEGEATGESGEELKVDESSVEGISKGDPAEPIFSFTATVGPLASDSADDGSVVSVASLSVGILAMMSSTTVLTALSNSESVGLGSLGSDPGRSAALAS